MSGRDLELPAVRRPEPHASRHRVHPSEVEVPSVLVRLAPVEHRRLEHPRAPIDGGGHDAVRDVRRIERVMPERRDRVFRRRRAVHERDRAERRLARGPARQRETGAVVHRDAPDRRQLHEEIVGMLPIDQRSAVERLAYLEDFAVAALADGRGVETQHRRQREVPLAGLPRRHAHPPVRHPELVTSARTALVVEHGVDDAVLHEGPAGLVRRGRGVVLVLRLRRRAESQQQKHGRRCFGVMH